MTKTTTGRPASRRKFTVDPAEREAKLEAAKAMLSAEVEKIQTSEDWLRWLHTMRRFHKYSFNNMLLIMVQANMRGFEATRCAGFGTWKEMGRCVRKGEKGLMIFRPNIVKIKPGEDGFVPGENRTKLVGFSTTVTFDISQTDGDPLPEPPAFTQAEGLAPIGLWDSLVRFAGTKGFSVRIGETGRADGHTDERKHEIVISERLKNDAHRATVLVHEIGHVMLHLTDNAYDYGSHRGQAEVEAESIAFVISDYFNLKTGTEPFSYIAGWAPEQDMISKVGQRIITTVNTILDAIEADVIPLPDSEDSEVLF